MLLHPSGADHDQRHGGGEHPDRGVHQGADGEGARIGAHLLLGPLDVEAQRGADIAADDVEIAEGLVHREVFAAQALGELERSQEEREGGRHAVRQQPQLEGRDVLPFRVGLVEEEAFDVIEDIDIHQPDRGEEQGLGVDGEKRLGLAGGNFHGHGGLLIQVRLAENFCSSAFSEG